MSATLSTIDSILKENYLPPIRELLNNKNLLLGIVGTDTEYVSGRESVRPLHIGRNEGLGARQENGTLPTAGNQSYAASRWGMTQQYARIQVTGISMASTRDSDGSFSEILDGEIRGLMNDVPRDENRQMFSGKSGELCSIFAGPTETSGITGSVAAGAFETLDGRFLRVNMVIDVYVAGTAGTNRQSSLTITSITKGTGAVGAANGKTVYTVAVSGTSTGIVATDIAVRTGSYNNEMFGLSDLIADANPSNMAAAAGSNRRLVGNIDRSSVEYWDSQVFPSAGAFGDSLFRDMIDQTEREADGNIGVFITTYDIWNEYATNLIPDRRFNTNGGKFEYMDGAYTHLKYNDVDVVRDRDCPEGTIYGLDTETLSQDCMADWDWMDEDGSILNRVPNTDAYEATLYKYGEFVCTDPAKNAVATGITT